MIRIGLPIPIHWRLRRYPAALAQLRTSGERQHRPAAAPADAWLSRVPWIARRREVSRAASLMTLRQFDQRFQCLIDVLCGAARDGVALSHLDRYSELRSWLLAHYEAVRPALASYIAPGEEDIAPTLGAPRRPRDAFESLFLPSTLESLINSDTVISRIQRTRTALDACLDDAESART